MSEESVVLAPPRPGRRRAPRNDPSVVLRVVPRNSAQLPALMDRANAASCISTITMHTIRLALLLCDDVDEHGGYAHIFHQFLSESLHSITPEATFSFTLDVYNVYGEPAAYPSDDANYDGLLISGSRTSPIEDFDWIITLVAYVKRIIAWKPSLKLFGVCFGHQIIARALGFGLRRGNWEVSATDIQLTSIGRAIFQTDKLNLQHMHRDQVVTSIPRTQLLGSTVVALNQGIAMFGHGEAPLRKDPHTGELHVPLTSIRVLTLQAHPEFPESIMRWLISEFADQLGQELVDDALSRVGLPTDAIDKVGRVMWGMLGVV